MFRVLAMTLVQDISPGRVEFWYRGAVDLADDTIDDEDKMVDALNAKVEKMQTGNGEEVHHR